MAEAAAATDRRGPAARSSSLVVGSWTWREVLALRTAYRMSKREFASVLGMTHKSVALWENPLGDQSISPMSQAALDTLLRRADPETRARFCVMVAQVGCPCSVGIGDDRASGGQVPG